MGRAYQNRKLSMAKTAGQKTKLYSKYGKEIYVIAKNGGVDPDGNLTLRRTIEKAKKDQVPTHVIEKAIEKAKGTGGEDYAEARYEGFGPGGVGIIVEASTDNKNRAATEVRTAFSKNGGNLGETGSVSFGFDQVGEIHYPPEAGSEDEIMEAAILAGAQDVETDAEGHWIYTAREDLQTVADALVEHFGEEVEAKSTKLIWKPQNTVPVEGQAADTLMKLLDVLDDLDDVANVYDNSELSDAEMARLAES